jgi:hypothetical protein
MKNREFTIYLSYLSGTSDAKRFDYFTFEKARQGIVELCEAYDLPYDWSEIQHGFEAGGPGHDYHIRFECRHTQDSSLIYRNHDTEIK